MMIEMMSESEKKKKGFNEFEIKQMVDCLQEAEEIKTDPAKMKAIAPFLKKKIKSLDDLKMAVAEYDKNAPDEEMD